ncbi:MAG: amidohydrolase family protein [Deltaproteobacteria bacterium]|nr:amidohydrolase family protein [Deltaproteobacteria bacterium]
MLLRGALLFTGEEFHSPGQVLVRDGVIVAAGPEELAPGPGARVLDLEGRYLGPGFIDAHVHLCLDASPEPTEAISRPSLPELTLLAAHHAAATLRAGVTAVRDLGGRADVTQALRGAVAAGRLAGPRIVSAGRVICMTGGHGWSLAGREADGPDQVVKAARAELKAGVDQVKFMATGGVLTPGTTVGAAQLTREELAAGITAAHRAGKRTAAHAHGREGILNAVRAGIDSVEHGTFLCQEAAELMARQGIPLVPTLAAGHQIRRLGVAGGLSAEAVLKSEAGEQAHRESLALARALGVKVCLGTDAGTPGNRHGENLQEAVLLAAEGLPVLEVLRAATVHAALALGLGHTLGRLAPGYEADLTALDGDPREGVALLARSEAVSLVIQGGRVVLSRL